ncbi:3,4-dihydroxy-2-butanone-4-phosphate synthase [Myroides odoratimimus]|uniref:3,4-dihydroxy-2-butanone-4-phosphate synthase n=1 Tax=Myroides odoratimimus TaxID=76832 RepID=UPI0025774C99|nr:3,4-dihydroxy-2-butanone-4-phosphate synthase [Myroides odoratimimus]MDM1467997.1 3,4-dihydroxy-2-butanone-4-phosphate synthase [Myroides odoratimimus]MDM1471302.1 3,4-dihydroxy-2-butanone-4-phosphate synthase [Myroides odoratimimus]MDM1481398.1 3,4-dihydroxy-2-butanone-4-phosphate synthase [Myroides odoratimimus]MDM1513121.1 3,4-dihydroxy-2-butanone-4-phosphate synthase [Myroides odoratimimus]MDM1529882.1 3,4-dihydroxy-2-butanone-4-phosphate synthase [Myroides odoratimimus]
MNTLENALNQFGWDSQERVNQALSFLKSGKGVLLLDDQDRENEGDIIFSAHLMSEQDMAMMIRYCSGVVCLCLTNDKADELELPYMVTENSSRFQTPFTVTIEAAEGVTTGLSAADRLTTVRAASDKNAKPADLARPGHIFPLRAKNGGVLERNGHAEGAIDLMKLAGLPPQAVLCELMNDDGTMARLPEVVEFAKEHKMMVLSIADLVYYRTFVTEK